MATGVMRIKLKSIGPGATNFMVIGIIIAKQNYKVIVSKKDNKEKSFFSFTIRDSLDDTVNVNVWGSNDYIKQLHYKYNIGDVVDLINSNVTYKPDIEEKFMPKSSSSFFLTLNENSSQMLFHDNEDSTNYKYLLRIPTSPQNMYLKIEDIHCSGKDMCGKLCSLLVAVRCVRSTKKIKTKNGKDTFLKEVIVMDRSNPTLIVKIWGKELSERATLWIPKQTILAFADLYLEWDEFKKNMIAVVSNKTIITEDPIMNEANSLKNYANTYSIGLSNKFDPNIPNLPGLIGLMFQVSNGVIIVPMSTITDIMTCKRILLKSNEGSTQKFTAVLYAIVSKFNIDGLFPFIFVKCNLCGMNVENMHYICLNPECPSNLKMESGTDDLETIVNIYLSLTDSTGTLENCILHHQAATKILSKVNNFQGMSLDQKTELKWKYLFTNCAIKLVVTKSSDEKLTIFVVDIDNEGPIFKFISHIPIY